MSIYLSNLSISFRRSSSETPLVDHWSVLNNFFATFDSWFLLYGDIYLLATGQIVQEGFLGGVTVWLLWGVVGGVCGTFTCGNGGGCNFWINSNFLLSSLNFCTMFKSNLLSMIFFSVINSLCNLVISLASL